MDAITDSARLKVRAWADAHKHAALYDDESATLLDVSSGKSVRLPWGEVRRFEEKIHPETGESYLLLMFEDGRQIVLVDPGGVAFAPSTVNSGPVENLPQAVCLSDVHTLMQRVNHYLYEHGNEPPPRECLDLIMMCIAILDGARAVGFDLGELERDLEKTLNEVERRTR
jgi:hypothetical protein